MALQRKPKLTRKIAGGDGGKASQLPTINRQGSKKRFGTTHNSDDSTPPPPEEGAGGMGKSGSHSARNPSPARPPAHGRSNSVGGSRLHLHSFAGASKHSLHWCHA